MQAKLIVVGGKASKREVLLKLPSTIGRSREAAVTVAHPMVSRKHCETYAVDGLIMIRDLGSLNGTYVAGQRVREAPLPPEQEFTVGPLTFRIRYEYSGDLSNLPPIVPMAEQGIAETSTLPVEPNNPAEPSNPAKPSNPAELETLGEEPTEPTPAESTAEDVHDPTPNAPDEKKPAPEDSALGGFLEELDLQ